MEHLSSSPPPHTHTPRVWSSPRSKLCSVVETLNLRDDPCPQEQMRGPGPGTPGKRGLNKMLSPSTSWLAWDRASPLASGRESSQADTG